MIFHVILICISLIISDVEHISYTYRPFIYFLWKNISSGPLPISQLGGLVIYLFIYLFVIDFFDFFIYFGVSFSQAAGS